MGPSQKGREFPQAQRQEGGEGGSHRHRGRSEGRPGAGEGMATGGLPFLEPQALPGSEGLGGIFQCPELVEKHHIKEDQQHQARTETGKHSHERAPEGDSLGVGTPPHPEAEPGQ